MLTSKQSHELVKFICQFTHHKMYQIYIQILVSATLLNVNIFMMAQIFLHGYVSLFRLSLPFQGFMAAISHHACIRCIQMKLLYSRAFIGCISQLAKLMYLQTCLRCQYKLQF
jgi:hypothetical protein